MTTLVVIFTSKLCYVVGECQGEVGFKNLKLVNFSYVYQVTSPFYRDSFAHIF